MRKGILICSLAGTMLLSFGAVRACALPVSEQGNYIDADGDGICDNREDDGIYCPQDGTGNQYRNGAADQNSAGNRKSCGRMRIQ